MQTKQRDNDHPDYGTTRIALKPILYGVAAITLWRAIWVAQDVYLFPNDPALSIAISAVAAILMFLFLGRMKI